MELTVEQQQKVAVAQYQVSEQGADTVFETALLRVMLNPDGAITFYNKKNNEKLTCVSEGQGTKESTLTEEEKAEARQKAIRQYQEEEIQKMKNRKKAKPTTTQTTAAPTLFDF